MASQQLLEMLGLEPIEVMIQKKRLQWLAHSARSGEADLTWRRMRREIEDVHSDWGQQIRQDWSQLRVKDADDWCAKVEDKGFLRMHLKKLRSA